ncbi:MAG: J domain-containing protein [Coleofasciculaceae cyanobacterium SM2_3_26]|nr:J domain-containing protein [Coleofasciculaceae cyanobacterium SM2_3_26]
MLVPLDYYRILGVTIQATAEQLGQAYRDRSLQMPRREYSAAAIDARKQLLDEAYSVLSDSKQRKAYDAQFLARTYEVEPSDRSPGEAGVGSIREREGTRKEGTRKESTRKESIRKEGTRKEAVREGASVVQRESTPEAQRQSPHSSIEIDDDQFVGALLILQEVGRVRFGVEPGQTVPQPQPQVRRLPRAIARL